MNKGRKKLLPRKAGITGKYSSIQHLLHTLPPPTSVSVSRCMWYFRLDCNAAQAKDAANLTGRHRTNHAPAPELHLHIAKSHSRQNPSNPLFPPERPSTHIPHNPSTYPESGPAPNFGVYRATTQATHTHQSKGSAVAASAQPSLVDIIIASRPHFFGVRVQSPHHYFYSCWRSVISFLFSKRPGTFSVLSILFLLPNTARRVPDKRDSILLNPFQQTAIDCIRYPRVSSFLDSTRRDRFTAN